jgi:hypothetical protein
VWQDVFCNFWSNSGPLAQVVEQLAFNRLKTNGLPSISNQHLQKEFRFKKHQTICYFRAAL